MVLETMRTTSRINLKSAFLIIVFLFIPCICSAENNWVIAVQKFSYTQGQKTNAVTDATSESLPADILEKLNKTLNRNIYPDERLERTRYKLRTERQSLYLQLTSEYKKRDSLLLNDYSSAKLKKAIKDEEKKIEELNSKIKENLNTLREQEDLLDKEMTLALSGEVNNPTEETELKRLSKFFKKIFVKDDSLITSEKIKFYRDDITALYEPSEADMENGYTSYLFEKSIVSAGINTLLTGRITGFGEYLSVEVDLYLYPGAQKVVTVMEIGSIDDMGLITSSIANQIVPYLTNSMPVELYFTLNPMEATANTEIFIDDVLQKTDRTKFILESGVHTIQFACEGYKTAETSYYFEGNKKYQIDVNLVKMQEGTLTIELKKLLEGDILVNGKKANKIDEQHTEIKINGNQILGEFIAENGETAFFYVPVNNYYDGSYVTINPKPFDRDKYIDTRRKWMYGAYSAFMVSLIPFFYSYGNLVNEAQRYKEGQIKYDDAIKWQNSYNAFSVVTIGCGIFWGYELVRYLVAANSVLPAKGKIE